MKNGVLCQVVYAHGNPHIDRRKNVYNHVDNVDKSYKCRKYAENERGYNVYNFFTANPCKSEAPVFIGAEQEKLQKKKLHAVAIQLPDKLRNSYLM